MAQLLVFRLGDEIYGLEVTHIQEIVEAPQLYYIPLAPAILLGAMNFHGNILPVLDLTACLGFGQEAHDHRIIVLALADGQLALAVSALSGIISFAAEELLGVEEDREPRAHVRAVLPDRGEMINLLDLDRVLGSLESFCNSDGRKAWG
jgi:purine-binding chemotaxis protein CheW